ncbi:MAG: SDR family oxidoreductase [Balneolaceae bacterium]|nr:MAG: SDR family oxidoreductase [Balneolaceae bacterium]
MHEDIFSLKGKTAAVIGGSGVLGGAMVQALAKAGAKTAVFYSGNPEGAESQKAEVEKNGGQAIICKADVRSEESLKKAFQNIEQTWGRLDILVNAPGVNSTTPVMEISEEEWDRIMDINLKGVFFASRIAADIMMRNNTHGSIINISSASSEIPLSKVFTYSISKAGMNNMTKFLAREWADKNIRVNALLPGFFPAEQNRKILTKERTEAIFNHTPMNRFGEPGELAGALIWLASEKASSFVTGAIISVDGGFTSMTI